MPIRLPQRRLDFGNLRTGRKAHRNPSPANGKARGSKPGHPGFQSKASNLVWHALVDTRPGGVFVEPQLHDQDLRR